MKYDGTLDIAVGMSAQSKSWKNTKYEWSELVQRLSEGHKTPETFKEFMASTKAEQLKIKDIGGYVGGYLRGGRRKHENVLHRQLITLDIDYAHIDFWEDFQLTFGNAAVLHATHKHHDLSPRFRLVMPLNREVSCDEYLAISRKVAGMLNIDLFDNTTFEVHRLMFWGSVPRDMDYYFRFQDGPFVDADEILDSYVDWTDCSSWPTSDLFLNKIKTAADKQEDPENKKGFIGAFCRTYSITDAISEFLPNVYEPTSDDRYYTYINGTGQAGLRIYEDKFAYSHHGTDPCSMKLCNAFDLVRIHLFGDLDHNENLPEGASPKEHKSFQAMEEFVRNDKKVKKLIAAENIESAKYDFAEELDYEQLEDEGFDWMEDLEIDARGKYKSTAVNINLIFANDIRLRGLFKKNNFDQKSYVFANMPWRKVYTPEPVRNVDFSGVRNYIESIYGISGNLKIEDAMTLEMERNSYHPVIEYLRSLDWDGTSRIDTLMVDYFGADDNIYTREAIRTWLIGAVARIMDPGCKFDYVLTIVGPQGCGKSTFLKILGKSWFSDTFMTVHGKEALEQIQGCWIIEVAELAGLRKSEVEPVKLFFSKQEDTFRPAYGRTPETYKRQGVFAATTNKNQFFRDATGNRRFNPIDVNVDRVRKSVWSDLPKDLDQIWAEAVHLYNAGASRLLSTEAKKIAEHEQREHSEVDERKGIIEEYLEKLLPDNWDDMDIYSRRDFMSNPITPKGEHMRDFVCIAEIWCECLGKDREDMDRYKTRDLNDIMKEIEGWELQKNPKAFKHYGRQKYYVRSLD